MNLITIIVVFYKQKIEESKTFQTLKQTLFSKKDSLQTINIILYDNSPEKQEFHPHQYDGIHISYIHDPRNLGIATAYNFAWSQGNENGSKWLLLLDHDTQLTNAFIHSLLNTPELSHNVAAVVPKIISENIMISPVFTDSFRPLKEERPNEGLQEKRIMAINSGALIRMEFLNEIGGFNVNFPLDYLDHWLFHEIYATGHMVWVLDVTLDHELSVMDYSRVSLRRYQSILDSEINFYKNYKKDLFPSYRKQLAKRFIKQALVVKNKKIALYTLRQLFSM